MALVHQALDALFFDEWLSAQGFTDPHLRWYLDYVCRDEYGAGLNRVSAWAGVHYFAARHGFGLPGETEPGHAVFTWPQGNARLVEHLAAPLGSRLHTGWAVQRVTLDRQHVVVEALSPVTGERARWQARHAILALPAQVLLRVLPPAADPAVQAARRAADGTTHAAWVVTNLHLSQPLTDRGGAAPAWDNVAFAPDTVGRDPLTGHGLGYVNATHQALHRAPQAPTVHTHFRALGPGPAARHALMSRPWSHWVATEVAPWRDAHPDLASRITHATVARHGHGMVVPVPGLLHQRWSGSQLGAAAPSPHKGPTVHWAHSDASGISTFEEAFAQGLAAARQLQQPPSQRTRANPPQ